MKVPQMKTPRIRLQPWLRLGSMRRLHRTELPIAADDTTRFLPWLMAFMVFLAALAVAGLFILADAAHGLDRGIENTVTIQIPASDNAAADRERIAGALALLKRTPGVVAAEQMPREGVVKLLEPWLGAAARSTDIPLPWVLDITLQRPGGPDSPALTALLQPYIPGLLVDDHGEWLEALLGALHSSAWIALIVVVLIGVAAAATVVFATRAAMGLHRETIEVMHFVGARDNYIARQFALRATLLGVEGAAIGIALAVPALLGLTLLIGRLGFGLLPEIHLGGAAWTAIAALVPATAVIAMTTARSTVLKSLSRMV
jgi:cell division transport system permease protein